MPTFSFPEQGAGKSTARFASLGDQFAIDVEKDAARRAAQVAPIDMTNSDNPESPFLFGPAQRQVLDEFDHRQIGRVPIIHDRFNDPG